MKNQEREDLLKKVLEGGVEKNGALKIAACMYSPIKFYLRHVLNNEKFELSPDRMALIDVAVKKTIEVRGKDKAVFRDLDRLKDHFQIYFHYEEYTLHKIPMPTSSDIAAAIKVVTELTK